MKHFTPVIGLALISLVACASPAPPALPTDLRGVEAKVTDGLKVTLSKLPDGATLTRTDPSNPSAIFGPGTLTPCDDPNAVADTVFYSVQYVLGGIPDDQVSDTFNNLVGAWRMLGWAPVRSASASDSRTINAQTPTATAKIGNGYTVTMAGTFQLYFTGRSACFPQPKPDDKPAAPLAI